MIEPYPFQKEAIDRMIDTDSFLLADEMGVGKTVTALGELRESLMKISPRILIVSPNSAKSVWEDHITLMCPEWPVLTVNSYKRDEKIESFVEGFLIINWEALRSAQGLQSIEWDYIIADEAHMAKNRKAKRTRALKKLRAKNKRALTGTPIINRPDELWSLLNWLYPKRFRSYWKFFHEYCHATQNPRYGYWLYIGPKNERKLREEIAPFTLRRLKRDVLPELPEKYYTPIKLELAPEQRRAYDQMKKHSLAWLEDTEVLEAPTVLAQLTRLRQFAVAYARLGEFNEVLLSDPSSKLDAMMELVESASGPVVVFSQFRQLIDLAVTRLDRASYSLSVLTGKTPQAERAEQVRLFQEGKTDVLLATMQTGGVGLTLTAASTCIFLDRSWSPAVNSQAEDRLHRSGQKNAVQVVILQAKDTVDETVEERLVLKKSWLRRILGD